MLANVDASVNHLRATGSLESLVVLKEGDDHSLLSQVKLFKE